MMKSFMTLAVIFGVAMLFAPASFAELIAGKVTSIDLQNKSLQISPQYSSKEDLPQDLTVQVEDDVFDKNREVQSLDQLSIGEDIVIEADKSLTGDWEAHTLAKMDQLHQSGQVSRSPQSGRKGNEGQPGPMMDQRNQAERSNY